MEYIDEEVISKRLCILQEEDRGFSMFSYCVVFRMLLPYMTGNCTRGSRGSFSGW